jgi:hypothetical protein
MPVREAKINTLKIKDLQSQCRILKNKLRDFHGEFFVHNPALEGLPAA